MTTLKQTILLVEMLNLDEDGHVFTVRGFLRLLASTKRMMAGGATEGEKSGAKLALERLKDRAKAELPNLSPADRRQVQQALGLPAEAEADGATPGLRDNPWSLYNQPGWRAVSAELNKALEIHLDKLDQTVAAGANKEQAAEKAYHAFVGILDSMGYGAGDTEGRGYMWEKIQQRIEHPRQRPQIR